MALIKCPNCGNSISEYAKQCPYCKAEKKEDVMENKIQLSTEAQENVNRKMGKVLIVLVSIVVLLVMIMPMVLTSMISDSSTPTLSDVLISETEENVQFYETLIGRELDDNEALSLKEEERKYIESCKIVDSIGDVTIRIPTINPDRVTAVIWTSQDVVTENAHVKILLELQDIYGEHAGLEEIDDEESFDYVSMRSGSIIRWEKDAYSIECQFKDNKTVIKWEELE